MDIKSLLPQSQEFKVLLPNGEDTGITFTLVGQDSAQFRTAAKAFATKQMGRNKESLPDLDLLERQRTELAAVCLQGWSGLQENDIDIPFSKEKALELLNNPGLGYLVEAIEEFVTRRANFFRPKSAPVMPVGEATS